ncbi:hypothetical protein GXM_01138 [Nostoc sphaeroides CCNUC1]|uniref:Uncharacterized protein n=1 Tax=Nostoc sphaeroides CCNUC1 TaxID=2653204 RepID=A0A5P8VT93_9NOSO|nr:hypothetical protein GXM_01138 [Nostoc sphaeroides CCNUC1]
MQLRITNYFEGLPSKKIFHCYCSLLTVDGSRVFSQHSTVNDFNVE